MNNAAEMFATVMRAERDGEADDTQLLAWADALQEDGDNDRAEFIHTQIARIREYPGWGGTPRKDSLAGRGRYGELARRERELLIKNEEKWRSVGKCEVCKGTGDVTFKAGTMPIGSTNLNFSSGHMDCPKCSGTGDIGGLLRRVVPSLMFNNHVVWRRGLPAIVGCRSLDEIMTVVGNDGWAPVYAVKDWAASVIRHHSSVKSFAVDGFEPFKAVSAFVWMPHSDDLAQPPHRLPQDIYYRLAGRDVGPHGFIYASRDRAMMELYRAVYLAARDTVFPNGIPA